MSEVIGWAQMCEAFDDLRRGARKYGLTDRFDQLNTDEGRVADRLADWCALREAITRAQDHQESHGKHPLVGDLTQELDWYGISDDPSVMYGCPDGRCARREAAIYDAPPPCDLLNRPMVPVVDLGDTRAVVD